MKTRLLMTFVFVGLFGLIPQTFADNEFCNIQENLKIQEELIKEDVVLIEFLKVFPNAELTRANFVEWSNPEQTSMTWTSGVYSLDIRILGFDVNNPSECFFPEGYRLNAPHLPEMTGNDYHDSKIVLKQIEELEPKYVKGGPSPTLEEPEPYHDPDHPCPSGLVLDWDICIDECRIGQIESNGVCTEIDPDSVESMPVYSVIIVTSIFVMLVIAIPIIFVSRRKRK